MAVKKSELYSSIWKSCDELRGGMDASQYKDYVLVMLFVKYVSDKYAGDEDAPIVVPPGGSFGDIAALKGAKDIGDRINKIIAALADENDLKGIIDVADFNDADKLGKGKAMVDRLTNLVAIFEKPALNFSRNRADGDDLLGDAYEYLMRNFATQSGKSKGQFYTPAEVSRVIAKVISIETAKSQEQTVYDPTCGSGSLLIRAADEAERGLTIYGQEMDNATRALAKMNMILHGHPTAEIDRDNTLASPQFLEDEKTLKRFDFAVANPPFSLKAWMNGVDAQNDEFDRFTGFGIPPAKNGDYAFLLHLIKSLKSTGKGAIVLPHGVLFRGNAEAEIRRNLVTRGLIKGIIGLPPNLFYGTGIPACIIVIDKENARQRRGLFILDASKGFVKDGNKNRLREQDIHKIVDVFNRQLEVAKYSRKVPLSEIEANEFNLNIPRYIDSQEEEDIQDLAAHLYGGLPQRDIEGLGEFWQVFPSLKAELFTPGERLGYYSLNVAAEEVKRCIFEHSEFIDFGKEFEATFETWRNRHVEFLKGLAAEKPKDVIYRLSEDLLGTFADVPLVDKYDVFQHLMAYWLETMRDDVYLILEEGWQAQLTEISNNKGKVTGYVCELIPQELMVARYFQAERGQIEALEVQVEEFARTQEELLEEHGGEEGLLAEVVNDKGKVTKGNLTARMKVLKKALPLFDDGEEEKEELELLEKLQGLMERQVALEKQLKKEREGLEKKVLQQYGMLTPDEVKVLVVDDKWMPSIWGLVHSELDRVSQRLTGRIQTLAERYRDTLSELEREGALFTTKVEEHLKQMGMML